jgi:hypothetical protein
MSALLAFVASFCAFIYSSEVATDQTARFVYAGTQGLDIYQNKSCFILSARYQSLPNGAVGDVYAAAMGYNLGLGILSNYPWTAVGYVKGAYDLNSYQNKALDQIHVDGAVAAWGFVGIGEFCDRDGSEGFQGNSSTTCLNETNPTKDCIINYYLGPQGTPWTQQCGQDDPVICKGTGSNFCYYGRTTSIFNKFVHTCRAWSRQTTVAGRIFNPYGFKCDFDIDYSGLWETNAAKISGCPAANRKIGAMINLAAAAFDIDVTIANNINSGSASPDANKITFSGGKIQASWDGTYFKDAARSATGVVTAYYLRDDVAAAYRAAVTVKQIIFTFDKPYSVATGVGGDSIYLWDPTTTVLDTAGTTHGAVTIFALFLFSITIFFL